MKREEFEELVLAYLDGRMSSGEKEAFEHQLTQHRELRERLENVQRTEAMLRDQVLVTPSQNFTQRVMQNLENYPLPNKRPLWNGLMLLFGIMVLVILCAILTGSGIFDSFSTTVQLENIGTVQEYLDVTLPSISIPGKLMVNTVILLNILIALVVLDRVVLRAWFEQRTRRG